MQLVIENVINNDIDLLSSFMTDLRLLSEFMKIYNLDETQFEYDENAIREK